MSTLLEDELPIRNIPETENWSESYAAMFGDDKSGASVFFSTGRVLSYPTVFREGIGVMLPGGRILYAKNYGRHIPENGVGASLTALTVPIPGQALRLTYDGPMLESDFDLLRQDATKEGPRHRCKIDLCYETITPICDMAGDSKEASTIAGSLHIEQIGRVNGTIEVGGETFELKDGYAVRDHSRGVRDVSQYQSHCWGNGPLGDGKFFYFYGM